MTVENILLDCDPGLDDAAAIFWQPDRPAFMCSALRP